MAELDWTKDSEGFKTSGYRIVPSRTSRDRMWRLDDLTQLHDGGRIRASFHPSVGSAMLRASREETSWLRRTSIQLHLAIGGLFLLMFAVLVGFLRDLPVFVLGAISLFASLRFLVDGLMIWLDEAWTWPRADEKGERPNWVARHLVSRLERFRRRSLETLPDPGGVVTFRLPGEL